jgi:hypothetical protein
VIEQALSARVRVAEHTPGFGTSLKALKLFTGKGDVVLYNHQASNGTPSFTDCSPIGVVIFAYVYDVGVRCVQS